MRTLTLCLGNSSLFGGVFVDARLKRTFRVPTEALPRVRGRFDAVALCSVVPARTPALIDWCEAALGLVPQVLTARAAHGLTIGYREPRRLGADRLAAAIGARARHPRKNVIVVDCGTATTVTALRRDGALLGGAILPGLSLWPEALASRTAQLPRIALSRPRLALGRSPREAIASGVFFGHVGAVREVIARVAAEAFGRAKFEAIGTGGHAARLEREKLFTVTEPDLILHGLQIFSVHTHHHP